MVEDYYTNPAISQSKLKLLLGPNPNIFNTVQEPELYYEEKKYFIIGDAVDIQITRSLEEFNQKFHISNLQNKPSDTVKSIVNQVYDHVKEVYGIVGNIQEYGPAILDSCNDHNYQPRWIDNTRITKVVEAWEYWEDLKAAEGKTVLSQEENDLISQIVMSIRTSPNTSKYFQTNKDIEVLYQLAIYFPYQGVDCKALLDMVVVDHKEKTIQPMDIKTMGDQSIYFPKSLRQRKYDIQAAFYTEALEYFKERDEPKWKDYKILPFKFIVESTINPGNPLVFTCSNELLFMGKWGREENSLELNVPDSAETWAKKKYVSYPEIKGFHQLIEDYKWYMENGFEKKREIVESQGEFEIDWNGITNF